MQGVKGGAEAEMCQRGVLAPGGGAQQHAPEGGEREDEEFAGAARPDGFLAHISDSESLGSDGGSQSDVEGDDSDVDGGGSDDGDDERSARTSRAQVLALATLAALLSALSLAVSVAGYLRPPADAVHPSPPLRSGTSCASGQALLVLTRTELAEPARMQMCVSEPVRWEAMGAGAACKYGGIRVALEEGGAAELCGMENVSGSQLLGGGDAPTPPDKAAEAAALITNFIADEPVRAGQVVSLAPLGGVAPFQLFRNVLWHHDCMHAVAVGVGHSILASLCAPAGGAHGSLLKLCSAAQHRDTLTCGRPVSAASPSSSTAAGSENTVLKDVLVLAGAQSRVLVISETEHGLAAHVLGANEGSLSLMSVASGNIPLNWTRGESTSGTLIEAVLLSRSHFAVVVWRAGKAGEMENAWLQCGLNNTQITCGQEAHGPRHKGRILSMHLTAVERDRLAMVCLVEGGKSGGSPGEAASAAATEHGGGRHIEITIWEGIGGGGVGEAALALEQRGMWCTAGVLSGRLLRTRLHATMLTPSKLVVAWAVEGGGVDAMVVYAHDDWDAVFWSPATRVLETHAVRTPSENEAAGVGTKDAAGDESEIQGLWACGGGIPDALAIVALRGHGRRNPRPEERGGVVGARDKSPGNVMWQIQLKADSMHVSSSTGSDAQGGAGLHVIGTKVQLWDDLPPSALSSGSAVAVAPNLVVSVAVAGPWVAARVVSFSAGVAAAKSSARAPSLPSSQSLEAGEAVSWERQLLARPVGVAIKSAAGGTSVPVAMSGAVDVFDRLVPGCRYLVDPDGSLRCGEIPPSDGGLRASDGGLRASDRVSHPLGLAVSRSVMVLSGPMPAAESGAI